jgi:hypothetical protein
MRHTHTHIRLNCHTSYFMAFNVLSDLFVYKLDFSIKLDTTNYTKPKCLHNKVWIGVHVSGQENILRSYNTRKRDPGNTVPKQKIRKSKISPKQRLTRRMNADRESNLHLCTQRLTVVCSEHELEPPGKKSVVQILCDGCSTSTNNNILNI